MNQSFHFVLPGIARQLHVFLFLASALLFSINVRSADLLAGVGKVDITREGAPAEGPNRLWAKALALTQGGTDVIIVSLDVVAIDGIGSVRHPYLQNVRSQIEKTLGVDPKSVVINASHCHGIVSPDIEKLTVQAITTAWKNRVPVSSGTSSGFENRIQENRRLILKDGTVKDVRHAYALPPNSQIGAVGPIDPEIGIVRLDRIDNGNTLALIYQFAVHPIKGIPSGGNTADLIGFASDVIESNLGDGTATAFFLQGCGGDINPADYKNVNRPRDAEPSGNRLGLSVLKTASQVATTPDPVLDIKNEILEVPRAKLESRIGEMNQEIETLTKSLKGTTLDFETFLPLYIKYYVNSDFPSEKAQRYLQDELINQSDWKNLDQNNRAALDAYLKNIQTMEELTRKQINLALLKKHQAANKKAGDTANAEVVALRIGDFRLVTFPAELTVEIGLKIKEQIQAENTYVSGYTNGYLFYAPTAEQLKNRGGAQEDSDCVLAPEWEAMFIEKSVELLRSL
ncbi:MAG: hypothetical protein P1V20_19450 [Verrucomicrobiales bacterium]|nr:hypothetical protein [Verrucomicrobiales bacterium]